MRLGLKKIKEEVSSRGREGQRNEGREQRMKGGKNVTPFLVLTESKIWCN